MKRKTGKRGRDEDLFDIYSDDLADIYADNGSPEVKGPIRVTIGCGVMEIGSEIWKSINREFA